MANKISETARKLIIDELLLIGNVTGKFEVCEFVKRVFPKVVNMKSTDYRYSTAEQDIWQHMDRNDDWSFEYLFNTYLNLAKVSDEDFIHFLEQYVHPLVQRFQWDEDCEERIDLHEKCVAAINKYLETCGFRLKEENKIADKRVYIVIPLVSGVEGKVKNIIFAATQKPEIAFNDVLNNDICITRNEEHCLIYDKKISEKGLTWKQLVDWYATIENISPMEESYLIERLKNSMDSEPEKMFFDAYIEVVKEYGDFIPALLPQVYLYYDPLSVKVRGWKLFEHQKMDFLMLCSMSERIVVEIDGSQHYAESISINGKKTNVALPKKYGEMVKAQREMTLYGYEVYRFGGYEFCDEHITNKIKQFLIRLLQKHGILEDLT